MNVSTVESDPNLRLANDLIEAVCSYFNLSPSDLMGSNIRCRASFARYACCYLIRTSTILRERQIGPLFRIDRTSVFYGVRSFKAAMLDRPALASWANRVVGELR